MAFSDLEIHYCPLCHIEHAIPKAMVTRAREERDKFTIYCPSGHTWCFKGERDVDKFRRERDRAIQEQARLADEAAAERRRAEKSERAMKKLKHRVGAGVCPCCTRSFTNLRRHMETKHPDQVQGKFAVVK